jgi:glyoxylase-like metal-dependent hydrolase (beta-lactamase superfamily II)
MLSHSRRGFIRKTMGALWTGGTLLDQAVFRAAAARAQAPGAPAGLFRLEKVATGVWAALALPAAVTNSNAAVFELSDGLLVVDTHSKPSAAAALVAQLRREASRKPVRYIVNSHFHWDHTQGLPAWRKDSPRLQSVAHLATRRLMDEHAAARLKASLAQAERSLDQYRENAGKAADPAARAYWQRMETDTRSFVAEMRAFQPELPELTFSDELTIQDRLQPLRLVFRGKGHTAGDVVVQSPARKVIATGDLLHGSSPFLGDGFPREWPQTLLRVAELEFDHVAGGHAGVLHGRERLYQMRDYIEELCMVVDRGRQRGRTVEQTMAETAPQSMGSLKGGYGAAMVAARREFSLLAPGASDADLLAGILRSSIQQVWAGVDRS